MIGKATATTNRLRLATWMSVLGLVAASCAGDTEPSIQGDVLLVEDFEDAQGIPFALDNDRFIQMAVEDGHLSVTLDDSLSTHFIRSILDRSYPSLGFEATVESTFDPDQPVLTSIGCWNADSGYLLAILPNGEAGLIETISEKTGERVPLSDETIEVDAYGSGQPIRLRIHCDGGGLEPTIVSAWVGDSLTLSVAVDNGMDSFTAAGFWLGAEGTTFNIDQVVITE